MTRFLLRPQSDIDEVRSMPNPPSGVRLTMQAACVMFDVKPIVRDDPTQLGKKIRDWWSAAHKSLLSGVCWRVCCRLQAACRCCWRCLLLAADGARFLNDLKTYDRDNIPDRLIAEIEPFIAMPEFEPEVIDRASKACSGICMWVRAMYKYYHVAKQVEPKKRKLIEAQETLDRTMAELNIAKRRLSDVLDRVAALEEEFQATQLRREQLMGEVHMCRQRLERANKLLGGLGGEQERWLESLHQVRRRSLEHER